MKGIVVDAREKNMARLYAARAEHLKWVNMIKLLVSGFKVDKDVMKPLFQDSDLGKWYYQEAIQFAQFNSQIVLDEMEEILESMYNVYSNIYTIYYGESEGGLKSFLGIKRSVVSSNDKLLASRYYEDIVKLSDELKKKFKIFERQLLALPNDRHECVKRIEDESGYSLNSLSNKHEEEEEVEEVYSLRAH
jgi:hypothetical protein